MNINNFAFLSFIKKMSLNSGNNSSVIFCKSFSLLFLYNLLYLLNKFDKFNLFYYP